MQPECSNAGSKTPGCQMHSLPILLELPESRISWRMEGHLKWRSGSPATLIVGQRSSTTVVARKSWSKIWSGSAIEFRCSPDENFDRRSTNKGAESFRFLRAIRGTDGVGQGHLRTPAPTMESMLLQIFMNYRTAPTFMHSWSAASMIRRLREYSCYATGFIATNRTDA